MATTGSLTQARALMLEDSQESSAFSRKAQTTLLKSGTTVTGMPWQLLVAPL